jgi:hypothetical protein
MCWTACFVSHRFAFYLTPFESLAEMADREDQYQEAAAEYSDQVAILRTRARIVDDSIRCGAQDIQGYVRQKEQEMQGFLSK